MNKRCICSRSQTFPLCDGQHGTLDWTCTPPQETHCESIMVGSQSLLSLVEYLCHHHQPLDGHQESEIHSCDELIVLYDGSQLNQLLTYLKRYTHHQRRVICIGCLAPRSLESETVSVSFFHISFEDAQELKSLHRTLRSFLYLPLPAPPQRTQSRPSQKLFISHSIQDEGLLLPVVDFFRVHYGLTLFVCANSIPIGVDWYQTIEAHLLRSDLLIAICSSHFNQSTFCSFEMGMARALNRPIYPIVIDGSTPPSYIQHMNAIDLKRLSLSSPWLSSHDALIQAFFLCLKADHTKHNG